VLKKLRPPPVHSWVVTSLVCGSFFRSLSLRTIGASALRGCSRPSPHLGVGAEVDEPRHRERLDDRGRAGDGPTQRDEAADGDGAAEDGGGAEEGATRGRPRADVHSEM
jgi:hypothetical protein